jgi:hypothetical protein
MSAAIEVISVLYSAMYKIREKLSALYLSITDPGHIDFRGKMK